MKKEKILNNLRTSSSILKRIQVSSENQSQKDFLKAAKHFAMLELPTIIFWIDVAILQMEDGAE